MTFKSEKCAKKITKNFKFSMNMRLKLPKTTKK